MAEIKRFSANPSGESDPPGGPGLKIVTRPLKGGQVNVIYPAYQAAELFRSSEERGLFDRPPVRAGSRKILLGPTGFLFLSGGVSDS